MKDIPEECPLVTLDIESLYTNIPSNEGIKAVRESYEWEIQRKVVSTKVIIAFLSLILSLE